MAAPMLIRLDERDRAIFARCVGHAATRRWRRRLWTVITHLGGATCSITAAIAPLFFADGAVHDAARHALLALVVSHLGVQLLKRTVSRPRPSKRETLASLVAEPDRFSFPSGHAAAAMAVGFAYAMHFPEFAPVLVTLATLVGASRVFLGVHYPGDVLVGQVIALATALML